MTKKNCPFCYSCWLEIKEKRFLGLFLEGYYVECESCHAKGPVRSQSGYAENDWNERQQQIPFFYGGVDCITGACPTPEIFTGTLDKKEEPIDKVYVDTCDMCKQMMAQGKKPHFEEDKKDIYYY